MREAILEKLKNLLNRTAKNGASEAEVETAMKMAQKLMEKHQIDLSEVTATAKAGEMGVVERAAAPVAKVDVWMRTVASCVCEITNTKCYIARNYKRDDSGNLARTKQTGRPTLVFEVFFYGLPSEVDAAVMLYFEYLIVFRSMARYSLGQKWTQAHFHYMQGFGMGILDQLREESAEAAKARTNNVTAMIRTKDAAMTEFAMTKGLVSRKKSKLRKTEETSAAYHAGRSDGRQYNAKGGSLENRQKRIS